MIISVDRVYFQCQKALARSRLWQAEAQIPRATLPTAGEIMSALDAEFDGVDYDQNYQQRMRDTLY
jgi:hypothetical protein